MSWRRLKPWRRLISQSLDPAVRPGALEAIERVEVEHGPRGLPQAWLLVGWLATCLGWRPAGRTGARGWDYAWRFQAAHGPVEVRLRRLGDSDPEVHDVAAGELGGHRGHDVRRDRPGPPRGLVAQPRGRAPYLDTPVQTGGSWSPSNSRTSDPTPCSSRPSEHPGRWPKPGLVNRPRCTDLDPMLGITRRRRRACYWRAISAARRRSWHSSRTGRRAPLVREEMFSSQAYATFDLILAEFSGRNPGGAPRGLLRGRRGWSSMAGARRPTFPGCSRNGHWPTGSMPRVKLLNDLEAAAFGMLYLRPEEMFVLHPGAARREEQRRGHRRRDWAGRGDALLGRPRHHPIASEGGHGDFGPRTALEIALMQHLPRPAGFHVSYERVLSGPGFHNIYQFLRDHGESKESPEMAERLPSATRTPRSPTWG